MHIIIGILIHSPFCAINCMLPAHRPNYVTAARTTKKDEQARCVRYSSHTTTDRLFRFAVLKTF